jgi:pimeloyl-ACP methyl ester carboxylesterase
MGEAGARQEASGAAEEPRAGVAELLGGEVRLCYELVGDPEGPVMVLVNGLGGQLIDWDPSFLAGLRAAGLATLRFDNRDAGLSSGGDPRFRFDLGVLSRRDRSALAYTLEDLADDVVRLLDALGVPDAHVLGVSMGGMIAQLVAIRHPKRVRSLCSVMSTTGAPGVGQPTEEAAALLTRGGPSDREGWIEWELANHRVLGSPGFPVDDEALRIRAAARYDRAYRPDGVARQLMAILLAEDRTAALSGLRVPTLVVHGAADPLIDVSGGEATARAVPGARLVVVPGMGHELPPGAIPTVLEAVLATVRAADPRLA